MFFYNRRVKNINYMGCFFLKVDYAFKARKRTWIVFLIICGKMHGRNT